MLGMQCVVAALVHCMVQKHFQCETVEYMKLDVMQQVVLVLQMTYTGFIQVFISSAKYCLGVIFSSNF